MKEFIEKLIERLQEQAEQYRRRGYEHEEKGYSAMADKYYGKQCSYLHSIEIVNQLAEECNNGWIPCSERLPEGKESHKVLVTDEDGIMAVCYFLEVTKIFKVCWDGEEFQGVVAWQPLSEPYQPKGE